MKNHLSRPNKAMEHGQYIWGDWYEGTMEQLIGTGKFRQEWFPGMPGNRPTANTLNHVEFEGRAVPKLHIFRKDRTRRRFTVWVSVNEQEQELRRYQGGYENARAKSMERASSWLRSMVKSEAEFVAINLSSAKHLVGMHLKSMKKHAGYSMTVDSAGKLDAVLNILVEILKQSGIEYSPEAQEEERRKLAADAFENQGLGHHIDSFDDLNIDREAEKERFIADALAVSVEGYISHAASEFMS